MIDVEIHCNNPSCWPTHMQLESSFSMLENKSPETPVWETIGGVQKTVDGQLQRSQYMQIHMRAECHINMQIHRNEMDD